MELGELEKFDQGRRSVRQWIDRRFRTILSEEESNWLHGPQMGATSRAGISSPSKPRGDSKNGRGGSIGSRQDRLVAGGEGLGGGCGEKQKTCLLFREAPVCIAVFVSQYQSVLDKVLNARERSDPEATQMLSFRRSAPTGFRVQRQL